MKTPTNTTNFPSTLSKEESAREEGLALGLSVGGVKKKQ